MMMALCMYDDGAFIIDQEYQSEPGYQQNVQSLLRSHTFIC